MVQWVSDTERALSWPSEFTNEATIGGAAAESLLCCLWYICSRLALLTVILGGMFDRFLVFKSSQRRRSNRGETGRHRASS